jgi:hypothetical protein
MILLPPASKLDQRHTRRLRKRDNMLTGERGWRRSKIIRRRESLVLYKSFKVHSAFPQFLPHLFRPLFLPSSSPPIGPLPSPPPVALPTRPHHRTFCVKYCHAVNRKGEVVRKYINWKGGGGGGGQDNKLRRTNINKYKQTSIKMSYKPLKTVYTDRVHMENICFYAKTITEFSNSETKIFCNTELCRLKCMQYFIMHLHTSGLRCQCELNTLLFSSNASTKQRAFFTEH